MSAASSSSAAAAGVFLNRPKRRRPNDKMLPVLDNHLPESKLYERLQQTEKRLDSMLMRKRLDIQEALTRPMKQKRTLRLFVFNTAGDQPWQQQQGSAFEGTPVAPNWTLRIEGRLIEPPTYNRHAKPSRKLTSFLRSIIVELDRDQELYPSVESNTIEWHKQPGVPDTDGFEVKRMGDEPVPCKIYLQMEHSPERFRLSPELSKLLHLHSESRIQIVMALWQYIKKHQLQDTNDKRLINADDNLRAIFRLQQIPFPQLNDLLTPHLQPMDPITVEYTIQVDQEKTRGIALDIEVEIEDPARSKMVSWVTNPGSQKEILTLDQQITSSIQQIHAHRLKREFMLGFAHDPVHFIQRWIDSQSQDLETVLGENQVNAEVQRRSDFYKQQWVAEGVFHYLHSQ